LARWSSFWNHAVLGGYGFKDGEHPNVGYVLSALVGMAVIAIAAGLVLVVVKLVRSTASPVSP